MHAMLTVSSINLMPSGDCDTHHATPTTSTNTDVNCSTGRRWLISGIKKLRSNFHIPVHNKIVKSINNSPMLQAAVSYPSGAEEEWKLSRKCWVSMTTPTLPLVVPTHVNFKLQFRWRIVEITISNTDLSMPLPQSRLKWENQPTQNTAQTSVHSVNIFIIHNAEIYQIYSQIIGKTNLGLEWELGLGLRQWFQMQNQTLFNLPDHF